MEFENLQHTMSTTRHPRIQAVSEGSIIPGATVPPPGLALGEVVAEAPPAVEPEAPANGVPVTAGVSDA